MEIHQREREGITVLDLNGRITVGPAVTAFRTKIDALVKAGVQGLILNLAEVDYVDSTGLGALVVCHTSFKKAGGTVKLLNVSRRNIELLVMTKLATVFEIFSD